MLRRLNSIFIFVCLIVVLFNGCNDSDPDVVQRRQTKKLMNEINRQIGMPNIVNFQQKKLMKMIYEECDRENLICYAYIVAKYSGKLVPLGRCVGYGVPFSAQYTNPERYYLNGATLPQPDPNGIFMPTSSSATWLLLIDPKTDKPRLVYVEPEIIVSPFPLR